ncbi:hypothetical protein Tco_0162492 [Tanacetum coccineum]
MVEEPLKMKKKDQISFDEQEAKRLQAEFDEKEGITKEKDEANIALTEEWDDMQAKVEADYQLAQRLQAEEQEELTVEEKATLFQQLLEKRRKHFAAKRAEEKRNRPPTKSQQRSIISKRAGDELEQENAKKQKVDDDQEAAKMKELIKIVLDEEEVAIDAIPLATKPPSIVDWKILKEGKISYFQIIRADGSSRRYSAFIQILKSFNREDLETLWKLVKAKHGSTRLKEGYERVLWGDLKTMFEPNVEDEVWKMQQMYRVLSWKLFDSCGVHCLTLQSGMIYMLVKKRFPLTPATITDILNRKLQADHWNKMCYQLLKLITKQLKNQ